MCTKPFSQTKNKGKLFLVAKSSGPLLARMPLNKEKSQFTPNNSPLSHYFTPKFCLKQSSRRDLSQHVKISFIKNDTISVADTLIKCTRFL